MTVKINLDGVLLEPEQAHVSVFDRGFLYGDSVYEVVRTYCGVPFALDRHLDRLARSAASLRLELPARTWLAEQIQRTLVAAGNPESYLRLVVTRGSGPISLDPTTAGRPLTVVLVKPLEPFAEWMYSKGIRVTIPQVRRQARLDGEPTPKTGNYLNSVLALGEARQGGFDDALLLDTRGQVAEGTSANVFAVRAGGLCTPTIQTGLLQGITRGLILQFARDEGISVVECELFPEDLQAADEVLLTSTLREVLPVVAIDQRIIGAGRPGPMGRRLLELFRRRALEMVAGCT